METADRTGELLRVLGLVFGLAAVVGGAVGQGILRTPGIVAAAVPNFWLILLLWGVGGLVAAITAVAYAELGTAIPRAGGPYVFVRRAFGRTTGIIVGWSDWFNNISTQSLAAVVVVEFVHRLGLLSAIPAWFLGPAAVAVFVALNATNTRVCGSTQSIGSALKGSALLALVLILLVAPRTHAPAEATGGRDAVMIGVGAIIVALRAIKNTYDGWNNCIYFCEEMDEPERHVPRALFGGIALVAGLYLLVNLAILRVLPIATIARSNLPAADALGAVLGRWADLLLTGFGIISVAAILNLNVMFGPRIALAMARDGVLPAALAKVGRGGVPRVAVAATSGVAALLAASGTYEELLAFNVAIGTLGDLLVCLSVVQLRRSEPHLNRPWRAPFYPAPIIVAVAINAALLAGLLYEDPLHSLAGVGGAVVIGLAYELRRMWTASAAIVDPV